MHIMRSLSLFVCDLWPPTCTAAVDMAVQPMSTDAVQFCVAAVNLILPKSLGMLAYLRNLVKKKLTSLKTIDFQAC